MFLDRDGVLNRKPPRAEYVRNLGRVRVAARSEGRPCAQLKSAGYRVIVISNQAGVARGAMTAEDLEAINQPHDGRGGGSGRRDRRDLHVPARLGAPAASAASHGRVCSFRRSAIFSFDLTRAVFIGDDERDRRRPTRRDAGSCATSERNRSQ